MENREYTDQELLEMQKHRQNIYEDNLVSVGELIGNTKTAKSSNNKDIKPCGYCNKPLRILYKLNKFVIHEKFCSCEKGQRDKHKHNKKVKLIRYPIDEANRKSLYYESIHNMSTKDKYNNNLLNDIWMHNVECVILELCGFDRGLLNKIKEQYRYTGFSGNNPIEYFNGLCDLYFAIQYGE